MKNFLYGLFSYMFMPAMLGLHFVTQHGAFLFIYGAMVVFAIIFLSIGVLAVVKNQHDAKLMNAMIKAANKLSKWKLFVSGIYNFSALAYLLYASAFFTASLLVVLIIVLAAYFAILWPLRGFTPLEKT